MVRPFERAGRGEARRTNENDCFGFPPIEAVADVTNPLLSRQITLSRNRGGGPGDTCPRGDVGRRGSTWSLGLSSGATREVRGLLGLVGPPDAFVEISRLLADRSFLPFFLSSFDIS
ncbi:hypothetical protein NL676_032103 [Syzygium grande]|nr:hypothetical protein NL676_032103 [Syzygium grande]